MTQLKAYAAQIVQATWQKSCAIKHRLLTSSRKEDILRAMPRPHKEMKCQGLQERSRVLCERDQGLSTWVTSERGWGIFLCASISNLKRDWLSVPAGPTQSQVPATRIPSPPPESGARSLSALSCNAFQTLHCTGQWSLHWHVLHTPQHSTHWNSLFLRELLSLQLGPHISHLARLGAAGGLGHSLVTAIRYTLYNLLTCNVLHWILFRAAAKDLPKLLTTTRQNSDRWPSPPAPPSHTILPYE